MAKKRIGLILSLVAAVVASASARVSPASGGLLAQASEDAYERARTVVDEATDALLDRRGVIGTGLGRGSRGEPRLVILIEDPSDRSGLPAVVDGVFTETIVTGELRGFGDCPIGPAGRCDRPVPPGVSLGHPSVSTGTLGALVEDRLGDHYILSNNHILAAENQATIGDPILQPGPFDGGSELNPDDIIGTLADFEPLSFCHWLLGCDAAPSNTMDAAIAAIPDGAVQAGTLCGWIPKPTTVAQDSLTPNVSILKKCGRTTGTTIGTVVATHATVQVQLVDGLAQFEDQIITTNMASGGDSGALMVDGDNHPVALLFAGGATTTVGIPIDRILDRFRVSFPDLYPPAAPLGLTAAAGDGWVDLEWAFSPEPDVVSYGVYRASAPSGPFAVLASRLAANAHLDESVTSGSTYFYSVTALDGAGNESPRSAAIEAAPSRHPPDDPDGDGVKDPADNCPFQPNAPQYDGDIDGIGATCDSLDRLWGADRFGTSEAVSQTAFNAADAVFIALGTDFPDAIVAAAAAGHLGSPVLLTTSTSLPSETVAEIQRLSPANAYVVGGIAAISTAVEQQVKQYVPSVQRLAGADRYETAAAVSIALFPAANVVFVAPGGDFPDALVAAAAAGYLDSPVLLTPSRAAPVATLRELARLKPSTIFIVGGATVISDGVVRQLAGYGDVVRLAGSNRFATASAVAQEVFGSAEYAFLASGRNFPDALVAAAAGGSLGGPVLLVEQDAIPGPTMEQLSRLEPAHVYLVGGTAVISSSVVVSVPQAFVP